MRIICAWCSKDMGRKSPYKDTSVTHSICPDCLSAIGNALVRAGKALVKGKEGDK